MPSKYLIYGLVDPRTLLVRYVGKSSSGTKRPREHHPRRKREGAQTRDWLLDLERDEVWFDVVVLEEVTNLGAPSSRCPWWTGINATALNDAERWWIAYGRALGWPLLNQTEGGDGAPGFKKSAETKAKIGLAHRGRPKSPESVARLRAVLTGRTRSRESVEKQRATITGRKASPEHREAIANALRGKPKSASHKQRMSDNMKQWPRANGRWVRAPG